MSYLAGPNARRWPNFGALETFLYGPMNVQISRRSTRAARRESDLTVGGIGLTLVIAAGLSFVVGLATDFGQLWQRMLATSTGLIGLAGLLCCGAGLVTGSGRRAALCGLALGICAVALAALWR